MRISINLLTTILLSIALSNLIFAQSGRKSETREPESVTPVTKDAAQVQPPCEKDLDQWIYIAPKKINSFVEELNRLGSCGYRLETVGRLAMDSSTPIGEIYVFGVVRVDAGNAFEYQWFGANNSGQVVTQANVRARDGFYFRKNLMFNPGNGGASVADPLESVLRSLDTRGNGSIYFFERKNGIKKKREYQMINGADARGKAALARNQKVLGEKVTSGFRPVGIFYTGSFDVFQILIERDEDIKPQGEYLILRYSYDSTKLFTRYASQGYRPLMVGMYFAVLHRKDDQPSRLKYLSDSSFKGMIKRLPKYPGARYETKGIDNIRLASELYENKPFFSVPVGDISNKNEYRFLQMTNWYDRYFIKKDKMPSYLDPPTTEVLTEFQDLLKQSFVIRDVYFGPEVTIIFERQIVGE